MAVKIPASIFVDNSDVRNSDPSRGTVLAIIGNVASIQLSSGEVLTGVNVTGAAVVGDDVSIRYERGRYVALGEGSSGGYASGVVLVGGGGTGSGAYVPLSRSINTTNGVMGGGTLATDLTLQVDGTVARQGWAVNAGTGMAGGGGLSAAGVTLSVDLAYAFNWSATHAFGAGARVSSSQVVEFGYGIAGGKQADAGKIGYQTFSTALDIVGAGLTSGSRMVRLWDDTTIVRAVGSPAFASGFTGSGWRVDQGIAYASQSTAEFDNLTVRGLMRVYELLIQKIRTGNGSYLFAPGGKVASVAGTGPYTLTFESDHGLAANDLIRAQKFDLAFGGVYQSNMTVTSVSSTTVLTASLSSGVAPLAGYEYARVGNTSDTNRQGGVYVTSDDSNAPYLDVFDGINAFSAWGSTTPKARLGRLAGITDALWGALSGYGLYTQSGYFTGGIRAMSGRIDGVLDIGASGGIYQGSGTFASPSTGLKIFNSGGIGLIAGYNAGAVQWQAGTDGKLYAGGGVVRLDVGGVAIQSGGVFSGGKNTSSCSLNFADGSYAVFGQLFGISSVGAMRMVTAGAGSYINLLTTDTSTGRTAEIYLFPSNPSIEFYINNTSVALFYNTSISFAQAVGVPSLSATGGINANGNIAAGGAVYASNWFRSYGGNGLYFEVGGGVGGGGWHMTDTTWLRVYNDKHIVTGGVVRADTGFYRGGAWGGIYVPTGAYYTCTDSAGTSLSGNTKNTGTYSIAVTSFGVPAGARAVQLAVSWQFNGSGNNSYYVGFKYNGQYYSVHRANVVNLTSDATVIIPIDSSNNITYDVSGRYVDQLWVGVVGYFY